VVDRLLTDDALWGDLVERGSPPGQVIWFYKLDTDRDIQGRPSLPVRGTAGSSSGAPATDRGLSRLREEDLGILALEVSTRDEPVTTGAAKECEFSGS
jgi:hypothetical protein